MKNYAQKSFFKLYIAHILYYLKLKNLYSEDYCKITTVNKRREQ